MNDKPPLALISEGFSSEYRVTRAVDNRIVEGVVILFVNEHREAVPIVRQLGFKMLADELEKNWADIDKDISDMKEEKI